ncbi:beta-propeller domain-containing protein [Hyalangium sp.]|uniref:beta-propeller domain-containing protein n=1 Tax=Hyalangium sp. TaxID=2028555 RepID=UPI002D2E503D|nr:beta-propeller domain-containing protein [Hyalangium sp.]HYH98922.1 beta-propeller domain-containing protein [Hyalangium sp.]
MKWLRYGGLGLALMGVGCDDRSGIPENLQVQTQAQLTSFDKCEDLESYIEDTAVLDMRAQLTWQKEMIGRWGRGGGVVDDVNSAPPGNPEATPVVGAPGGDVSTPAPRGPGDYTDTNNQVAGVDEADFVKNDGTRIFVVSGRKLYVHRSWPAESLSAVGSLALEGWPREMFLKDNRVVIFSEVALQEEGSNPGGDSKPGGGMIDVAPCDPRGGCGSYGMNATKVTVVDVSNLASPRVEDQLFIPGRYAQARRTNSSVRLLLNDNFRYPQETRWWPTYSEGLWQDEDRLKRELDKLMVSNEQAIRQQTLKQWLPSGWRKLPDGSRVEVGYDCRDFYRSNTPAKLGFVTVASLDLDDATTTESTVRRTSLVAEPGQVYASTEALYLASQHWWWWPEDGQKDYTYLHKFDTREPGHARYAGSGVVEGYLLNQFSMDEYKGVLRVATTIATWKRDNDNPWGRQETTNRLFTFREEEGRLVKLGQTEELAKGERIYSARFLGNKGYVVTFRQVDPLFTFDLSDPENPRKVGELKVPGFSSYIHPLDENHLITIGVHVPEDQNWRERALKLSLFDVSDPAEPKEKFTRLVGTAYGWSEALYEHKAFNFFPAKGLLAIPFSDYVPGSSDYWSSFRSELRVFRVDAATGFSPVGAVSMSDVYQSFNNRNWTWYWTPTVRRSVMADDYVYAITDAGVRVAHVSNLQVPLATTYFQPDFYMP